MGLDVPGPRDFDACAAWDRENLARVAAALNELGARLRDFPPELPFPPITAGGLRRQLIGTWRTNAHRRVLAAVEATAAINRLRVADPPLDQPAADRAAAVVTALSVSVADAHIGSVLSTTPGHHAVLTSDGADLGRIAAHLGIPVSVVIA